MSGGQDDLSAVLQQGTREYTQLYERHAYRVYNLALRIACERERAIKAAEEAFLTQAGRGGDETALLQAVARFAVRDPGSPGAAGGAGGADAEALLRATARLPAPERAALALAHVARASSQDIAAALELTEEAAEGVRARAYDGLAAALSVAPERARATYEEWLQAEPPAELWERVYPRFYVQLEKEARAATGTRLGPLARTRRAAGGAAAKASTRRGQRRARRAERGRRRLLRPRSLLVLGVLAAGGLAVTQSGAFDGSEDSNFAYLAEGEIPGVDEGNTADVAQSDGDPYDPLTPKELDKLRLEELQDLREQGEQEQARELAERRAQARKETAAARRSRALERRRALAERKRAERERKLAERQHEAAARREARARRQVRSGGGDGGGDGDAKPPPSNKLDVTIDEERNSGGGGSDDAPTRNEADERCLYNEESGTYVCPD